VMEPMPDTTRTEDRDIGRCDDCGTEEGDRQAWRRPIIVAGQPEVVTVWLCEACRG